MTDVVMPQMGESIVEGTLTKWLKKAGEHVERDEPLFEISTDKVDTEIPAPAAGRVERSAGGRRQDRRDQHRGGTHRGRRGKRRFGSSTAAAKLPEQAAPAPAASRTRQPAPAAPKATARRNPALPNLWRLRRSLSDSRRTGCRLCEAESPDGPLSPLVRKMAREYGIDLRQVKGTGAGGRITKQDLEAYMSAQGARTMAQVRRPLRSRPSHQRASATPVAAVTPISPRSSLRRRCRAPKRRALAWSR